VKNSDLWRELADLVSRFDIEWELLEGHVGVAGNERADKIATGFADLPAEAGGKDVELYNGPLSEYGRDIRDISHNAQAKETRDGAKKALRRSSGQARSTRSGRAHSYVSMVDGEIKTHETWAGCEKRVKGKNAWFRKAMSKEEEEEIKERFRIQSSSSSSISN
jgi:ribonuclease HI